MLKAISLAGFVLAATAGSGLALPAQPGAAAPDTGIIKVQHKKHHYQKKHWQRRHYPRHRQRYWYRRHTPPPYGWHRYHARPWDWERRGCLMFGPVWFCP